MSRIISFLMFFSLREVFSISKSQTKTQKKKSPWISNGIAKSSKRKQKLYEKCLKQRTPEKKETYKAYKNFFEMIKRKPKKKTILQN